MAWSIEVTESAEKQLSKIDRGQQKRIINYLESRIATAADPRQLGKPLTGEFSGMWRYRVGDYRLICSMKDEILTVLVLKIAHRRMVYK